MSEPKLLGCPFCGLQLAPIFPKPGDLTGPGLIYVRCDCGATGTGGKTVAEAISAWNTRAKPEHGEG